VLDERGHHPLGRRPGAVRGADGLHDLLEHGRAAEQAASAGGRPREHRVGGRDGVERREVLVEAQEVARRRRDRVGVDRLAGAHDCPVAAGGGDGELDGPPRDRGRHAERARDGVDRHRREVGDAVRADRAPEVDRLAARAAQREVDDGRCGGF
jgi:hypothetical protein